MQVTGSYMNYLSVSNLLTPLGVQGASDLVMNVFRQSVAQLQEKVGQQIFSNDSNKALQGYYQELTDLSAATARLTADTPESVFNDRSAASSNTKVLSATAWDAFSAESGATEATYQIQVQQLAQAQENAGTALEAAAGGLLSSGAYEFEISANGQTHNLSIEVSGTETNEELLAKIGEAIDRADIDINAQIVSDSVSGTAQLLLSSAEIGTAAAFSVADTVGDLVNRTGIASIKTQARDAAYQVDGRAYTASSNAVYLDDGAVQMDLKSAGTATLTVGPDAQKIQDAVMGLVVSLNDYRNYIEKNETYLKDSALSPIQAAIDDLKDQLGTLGITQKEDGSLTVDQAKLKSALQKPSGELRELISNVDGVATRLDSVVTKLGNASPLTFAREAEQIQADFEDFIYNSSAGMLKRVLQVSLLNEYI